MGGAWLIFRGPWAGTGDFSPKSADAHSQEFSAVTFSQRAGRSEPVQQSLASPSLPQRGRGQGAGPEKGLGGIIPPRPSLPHLPAARTDGRNHGSPRGLLARCAPRSRLRRRSGAPYATFPEGPGRSGCCAPPSAGRRTGADPTSPRTAGVESPLVARRTLPQGLGQDSFCIETLYWGFQPRRIWGGDPLPTAPRPQPPPSRRRISMSDASGPGTTRGPRLTASQPRV